MPVDALDILIRYGGTILAGAVGVGVGWATIRERSRAYQLATDKEIAIINHRVMTLETRITEKVSKVETKLESQVGDTKCFAYRTKCQENICSEMTEIKNEIKENRNIVIEKIEYLMKFVGRVEEFMFQNKQKGG